MPLFSANLSMLFTEKSFLERFQEAKEAGFQAIEFMFPYDYSIEEIKRQLLKNKQKLILFNLPAGQWLSGERGIAIKPERKEEFRSGAQKAAEYAEKLEVKRVNCLVGIADPSVEQERLWGVLVDNIRFAADTLKEHGADLMVEAINHFDMPGFFLNKADEVLKAIEYAGCSNVYLQYDVYHAEREQEDHMEMLRNNLAKIGHIQIADVPGRHQPGTGKINYRRLFQELDKRGYQGYVGLEYQPVPNTCASLNWIKEHGVQL